MEYQEKEGTREGVNQAFDPMNTQKIEVLIKVLGTMVMKPQYESDPNVIGSKVFTGMLQTPIINEDDRLRVESKLMKLIYDL